MVSLEQFDEMINCRWKPLSEASDIGEMKDILNRTTCYFCTDIGCIPDTFAYDCEACLLPTKLKLCHNCVQDYDDFAKAVYSDPCVVSARKHAKNILNAIIELRNEAYPGDED